MTKRDVPVFIVGMNGSGTTMLADSLGNHPRLYMLPLESKVLPYYLTQEVDCADLAARKKLADTIGRENPFGSPMTSATSSFRKASLCKRKAWQT